MSNLLIDYKFDSLQGSNPDGTFPFLFNNGNTTNGPGQTSMGNFAQAINLGSNGKAQINIGSLAINKRKFAFQFCFKAKGPVNGKQNLFESNLFPFAINLTKGSSANFCELNASVKPHSHGWNGPSSEFKTKIKVNKWIVATVAYDVDTLALFIDDTLIGVHAFPNGEIKKKSGGALFIGSWVDGRRNHFKGDLAAFKWFDGIPGNFESLLDEKRTSPEWFISYKYEEIRSKLNFGNKTKKQSLNTTTGSHSQNYQRGTIMYHDNAGVAFEMHGSILAKYNSFGQRNNLGYLVSDESNSLKRGGKKSLFSKGGIYWSASTGAKVLLDRIYLEYENFGEASKIGFPTSDARTIPGGKEQIFQGGRMYHRNSEPTAHEVHGAILDRFIRTGGTRKWGFPVSNEMNTMDKRGRVAGRCSEFEGCKIYWKSGVGAFEVHGHIGQKYEDLGGPLSELGFPTSDEVDIPGVSGSGKMNTFQKGSILWYGSWDSIIVARPFKIFVGRIDSKEDEGIGMGQNDLYFQNIRIKENTTTLHNARMPRNGDYGNHNIKDVNKTLPPIMMPNKISKTFSFRVKIQDADPGPDDHLGTKVWTLNAANAWGLRNNFGFFNESFHKIRSFTWSVKPQININALTEIQKWWGQDNFKTPTLSKLQAASAFRDMDSDPEWWDLTDWLEKAYYELVVKGIASGGNCFGMSLESINSRKNVSVLSQPLQEKKPFNRNIKNEINIKQAYQVGAGPIWWFLGQFVSGNTHDPVDVFNRTHAAFRRGDNPVVCIAQNYDFSGGPHCVLPVAWDKSSIPWKMTIMDPNSPDVECQLTVNPNNNTFRYQRTFSPTADTAGSFSPRLYKGGAWSGGRFHYMPWCILNKPQRTPIWDAILLLLSGVIIILAEDAETVSIKDLNGKDLDANGNRAKAQLKAGVEPHEHFVSYVGFDRGVNIKPGQIMMRREHKFSQVSAPGVSTPATSTLRTVTADRRFSAVQPIIANTGIAGNLMSRNVNHILADPATMNNLSASLRNQLTQLRDINQKRNYIHETKGVKNGKFSCAIKNQFSEILIESPIQRNEKQTMTVKDLGSHQNRIELKSVKNKKAKIKILNKLGLHGDFIEMSIGNISLKANQKLEINVKKGIAGVELINQGIQNSLNVNIKAKINGRNVGKNFTVPFNNGARIKPSSVLQTNLLEVGRIDNLFGPILRSSSIRNR